MTKGSRILKQYKLLLEQLCARHIWPRAKYDRATFFKIPDIFFQIVFVSNERAACVHIVVIVVVVIVVVVVVVIVVVVVEVVVDGHGDDGHKNRHDKAQQAAGKRFFKLIT